MKIAISACLLDIPCRYDGRSKPDERVMALASAHDLIPICPEQLGGLSIPHPASEIDATSASLRVISEEGKDVTRAFERGAQLTLERLKQEGITLAILKERSPSCGSGSIYDGSFSHRLIEGDGVTTRLLRNNGIRILSESQLDAILDGTQ